MRGAKLNSLLSVTARRLFWTSEIQQNFIIHYWSHENCTKPSNVRHICTARPKRLFPFYNDTLTSRKLALDSLSSTECNHRLLYNLWCNEHAWPLTLALPVKGKLRPFSEGRGNTFRACALYHKMAVYQTHPFDNTPYYVTVEITPN